MIREEIKKLIQKSTNTPQEKIQVEQPENEAYGDYSTNVALQLKRDPAGIVKKILPRGKAGKSDLFEKIEVVKPGFINFFISKKYLQQNLEEILKEKDNFGSLKIGKNKKVNIEFISANPTGPLHIGNGRGGFCGDVLANILDKAGYKVSREYYVNDMGRQIEILKNSLENRQPAYKNPYIDELKEKGMKEKDIKKVIEFIVGKIKKTTKRMGIEFDRWFYESDLYKTKEVDEIIILLKKKNLIYEKEKALWFKSTKFGDDKDRVLIKKDDKETYFLSDVAYLRNKFKRGLELLIIFLGAEHHGYTGRLESSAEALGYDKNKVVPIIMQLVKLLEKGQQVRMSKRTGIYVTLDELIDEVGKDISRFFFLTRNYGNHLNFDLDLAKQQSEKNPVYYVQYAHARICSILKKAPKYNIRNTKYNLLSHPSELKLIKQLIRLPEIIEDTSKDYQVQRLPQYAMDLATVFHQFYRDCRVLTENGSLIQARLALVLATKTALKNTLDLMGISAPEHM